VRRAELDQLYPGAESGRAPVATGFPRKDNRGRKSKIDWARILVVAAGLMARNKYSQLSDFQNAVYEHFNNAWPPEGVDNSTLNHHLKDLYNELRDPLGII
jgi:hypothetical protein